eukprot:4112287-Pleurochrysis_carterae.AAC.1
MGLRVRVRRDERAVRTRSEGRAGCVARLCEGGAGGSISGSWASESTCGGQVSGGAVCRLGVGGAARSCLGFEAAAAAVITCAQVWRGESQ